MTQILELAKDVGQIVVLLAPLIFGAAELLKGLGLDGDRAIPIATGAITLLATLALGLAGMIPWNLAPLVWLLSFAGAWGVDILRTRNDRRRGKRK